MKRIRTYCLPLLMAILAILPTYAQLFPPQLNGTMMPFDFSRCDTIPPWDDTLTPVFINYMARHGARFLSSEKKVDTLRKELTKAKSEGYLSEKGVEFLRLLQEIDSVTDGDWGALNTIGIYEEQRLGKQMTAITPELLKKGRVVATATYVPRVVMTMYELCHELTRHSSYLEITASEGRQFNPMLRFFTTDSTYIKYLDHGKWIKAYDSFVAENVPGAPAQSMFTKEMEMEKMKKLTLDMYGVVQSLPAAQLAWHPGKWFSESEYRTCWEAGNLKHYYQRSANKFSSIPATSARTLLQDIINTTDSAANGSYKNMVGKLRFGHAETVIPLFALMKLPGCYSPEGNANEISDIWKDWKVSPLGANLLISVLKDKTGETYVAIRLNGEWISLSYKTGSGIITGKVIPWKYLKTQWQSYCNDISPTAN